MGCLGVSPGTGAIASGAPVGARVIFLLVRRSAGRLILLSASDPTSRYIEQMRLSMEGGGESMKGTFMRCAYELVGLRKKYSVLIITATRGHIDAASCFHAWGRSGCCRTAPLDHL